MKLDPKKPLFGETAAVNGRKVVWELTYSDARQAAIAACERFDLDHERDFWIKMEADKYENVMHFQNLIIRHSAVDKINSRQPRALQFDPDSVKEGFPTDGGACYIYKNSTQGVFTTGEANPMNCEISYINRMARHRLVDSVVLTLAGLSTSGIYSELESEDFKRENTQPDGRRTPRVTDELKEPESKIEPVSIEQDMSGEEETDYTPFPFEPEPETEPISEHKSADQEFRLELIRELMEATKTKEEDALAYFKKSSLAELSEAELKKMDEILHKKLHMIEAQSQKQSFADRVVEDAQKNATDRKPSPQQMTLETAPLLDVGFEEDDEPASFELSKEAEQELVGLVSEGTADGASAAAKKAAKEAAEMLDLQGTLIEEWDSALIQKLFGRKNSKWRKFLGPVMQAEVDLFLTSAKKQARKEALNG